MTMESIPGDPIQTRVQHILDINLKLIQSLSTWTNLCPCNCRKSSNYRFCREFPQSVAKVDLHHRALGSIGLHRYGDHVLSKGQTRFPAKLQYYMFPPTLGCDVMHQSQGRDQEKRTINQLSVSPLFQASGLSHRWRGSCSHEPSSVGLWHSPFVSCQGESLYSSRSRLGVQQSTSSPRHGGATFVSHVNLPGRQISKWRGMECFIRSLFTED